MPRHLEIVVGHVYFVIITISCVEIDPIWPQNATQVGILWVQIDHAGLEARLENFSTDYSAFTLLAL